MKNLEVGTSPEFEAVYAKYPGQVRQKMLALRDLIVETAMALEGVTSFTETLKWG